METYIEKPVTKEHTLIFFLSYLVVCLCTHICACVYSYVFCTWKAEAELCIQGQSVRPTQVQAILGYVGRHSNEKGLVGSENSQILASSQSRLMTNHLSSIFK